MFEQRLISTKEALELEVYYLNRDVLSTLNFSKTKYELNIYLEPKTAGMLLLISTPNWVKQMTLSMV